jgi:hypothetical protein
LPNTGPPQAANREESDAQRRMMTEADPTAQQVISADDIREVP